MCPYACVYLCFCIFCTHTCAYTSMCGIRCFWKQTHTHTSGLGYAISRGLQNRIPHRAGSVADVRKAGICALVCGCVSVCEGVCMHQCIHCCVHVANTQTDTHADRQTDRHSCGSYAAVARRGCANTSPRTPLPQPNFGVPKAIRK
jgi:hypothetical protein